ncbi:unnamed protein product [Enterobius vermicularis]|uniref:Cylicin_N domain-containing protein n=1 Tax=Enterobius vermicularis TaxID=51028 RepID=A0A0N4VQV0_ENTVE|nr:unnamed protein product [Enterobius vermicularis]
MIAIHKVFIIVVFLFIVVSSAREKEVSVERHTEKVKSEKPQLVSSENTDNSEEFETSTYFERKTSKSHAPKRSDKVSVLKSEKSDETPSKSERRKSDNTVRTVSKTTSKNTEVKKRKIDEDDDLNSQKSNERGDKSDLNSRESSEKKDKDKKVRLTLPERKSKESSDTRLQSKKGNKKGNDEDDDLGDSAAVLSTSATVLWLFLLHFTFY